MFRLSLTIRLADGRSWLPALFTRSTRQARGGNGLAVALFFFVGDVKFYRLGQFRKFQFQHLARAGKNQIGAWAGSHSAENQDVLNVIKIGVMGDGVAEIRADGLV